VTLTRALACVLGISLLSCAHEPQEHAIEPAASPPRAPPNAAPFPDTAFRDDASDTRPSAATSPPPSRFDTHRIGEAPAPAARFHGAPVDLDLKSADLANVFRLLADVGHVNIVVSGEVTGTVTLRLKHVPWDQALELVARTHDLDLEREGNVIVVRSAGKH
jgi:hypothetical protein